MTLRSEIEALLVEFEHFAYEGAPLDVAVEKLHEILARTKPRVLTTVEELDSEEASMALGLNASDGSGLFGFYGRTPDGRNEWTATGTTDFYTSSELVARYANFGDESRFTLVHEVEASVVPTLRVLTTEAELNSPEVFDALCIVPEGGPLRVAVSSSNGVTSWQEPGWDGEMTSAELLAHFASIGAEPRFTVIEG